MKHYTAVYYCPDTGHILQFVVKADDVEEFKAKLMAHLDLTEEQWYNEVRDTREAIVI